MTTEYHKIDSVFLRDPATKHKTFLENQWTRPEFGYLQECMWVGEEKVDGTNIRIEVSGGAACVKGRTDRAQIPLHLLAALEPLLPKAADALRGEDGVIYGEGYGVKIQKGGGNYIADGVSLCVFDVRIGPWWLGRDDVTEVAEALDVERAPTVYYGNLRGAIEKCRTGFASTWGAFGAEGLILRPEVALFGRDSRRVITKVKTRDFR